MFWSWWPSGSFSSVFILLVFQLVLTVGLLAVVVYLYTVVAFNFFRKFYNKSEDGELPDMKCDDMLTVSMINISTFIGCICYEFE